MTGEVRLELKSPAIYRATAGGAAVRKAMVKPAVLTGMVASMFTISSVVIALISAHVSLGGLPVLVPAGICAALLFFGIVMLGARLRQPILVDLSVGLFYPIAFIFRVFGFRMLYELSLLGLAESASARGQYELSVPCRAEFLRNLKPLERDSSTRKDIGVELLYAGQREEALAYAKEVAHFGELFISRVATFTEEGAGRAARMLYSAVVIHAEAGEQAQAEVYRQRICDLFLQSKHLPEARSFALLCCGQSLALKGEWTQADEVLRQWVEVAESNVYVKNTAGPMASGYGLLAVATARGGDAVWAKSYLRRSLASTSKDFCLQTRTREAELEREVRVLLGEEIGDKNAALTGATISGDAEVEIESGVVPIEAESGAISTVLARQGRARFMVGLAVGYLYLSNKFTDVPTLAISALLLVAVLALLRVRSAKSVQRARQAIAANNTQEVIVIAGSDRLTLRKIDPNDELNMYSANEIGVYHANEALIEACQACVSDNPFRATMYLDAAGKPAAIECFGYYSALSKSAILAD